MNSHFGIPVFTPRNTTPSLPASMLSNNDTLNAGPLMDQRLGDGISQDESSGDMDLNASLWDQDTFTMEDLFGDAVEPGATNVGRGAAQGGLQDDPTQENDLRILDSSNTAGLSPSSEGVDAPIRRRGTAGGISYTRGLITYYSEPEDVGELLPEPSRNEGVVRHKYVSEKTTPYQYTAIELKRMKKDQDEAKSKKLKRMRYDEAESEEEYVGPAPSSSAPRRSMRQAVAASRVQYRIDSDAELDAFESEEESPKSTRAQFSRPPRSTGTAGKRLPTAEEMLVRGPLSNLARPHQSAPRKAAGPRPNALSKFTQPPQKTFPVAAPPPPKAARTRRKASSQAASTTATVAAQNTPVTTTSTGQGVARSNAQKMKWSYRMRFVLHRLFVYTTTSKGQKEDIFNRIFHADLIALGITGAIDIEKMRKANSDKKRQDRVIADCAKILADDVSDKADDAAGVVADAARGVRDAIKAEIVSAATALNITL